MIRLALLVMLLCAADSQALELFQCTRPDGSRAFQDTPCAERGAKQEVRTLPDHPLDAPQLQAERVSREATARTTDDERARQRLDQAARARLPASLGGPSDEPKPRPATTASRRDVASACARARLAREEAYRTRSYQMSFDERRRLQDAEDAACGLR